MEFRREVKTENNTWEYLHINGILKYEIGLCPHQANTVELKKKKKFETSLVVQLLRLCPSNAGGVGSIPGQRTEIPHAAWHSQKGKITMRIIKKKYLKKPPSPLAVTPQAPGDH